GQSVTQQRPRLTSARKCGVCIWRSGFAARPAPGTAAVTYRQTADHTGPEPAAGNLLYRNAAGGSGGWHDLSARRSETAVQHRSPATAQRQLPAANPERLYGRAGVLPLNPFPRTRTGQY